jgi:hypothetical protein
MNKLKLSNGHESIRESDLVIYLQKQLESEKLNSQNLRRQLEMERKQQSADLILPPRPKPPGLRQPDPIGSPAPQLLSGLPAISRGPPQPITSSFASLRSSGDALGLRGILELASSSVSNGGGAASTTPLMSTPPPPLTSTRPPLPPMTCPPPPLPAAATATPAKASNEQQQQRILEGLLVHFPGMTEAELHRHLQQLRAVHGRLSGLPLSTVIKMIKDEADKHKGINHVF